MTGPWNLGEFRRRLPAERQDLWMTCPLPAPDGAEWPGVSLAGGSSLAIFRASRQKDAAWMLAEYLSEPEVQKRFYELSGDLPARREAWDSEPLAGDAKARAFRIQLSHVQPLPRVPEWEQIAQKLPEDLEAAIRGRQPVAGRAEGARRRRRPHPREAAMDPRPRGGAPWPLSADLSRRRRAPRGCCSRPA